MRSFSASQVAVEVDGKPAPWLGAVEISRALGPKLNRARFRVIGGQSGYEGRFEELAQAGRAGQRITAKLICSRDTASGNQLRWPLFTGVIVDGQASLSGEGEGVEVQACDSITYGSGAAVAGIRALGHDGAAVYIKGAEAVFNPDGCGNASAELAKISGSDYRIFQANEAAAVDWSCAAAIRYVANEHLGDGAISDNAFCSLVQMTIGQVVRDVDVSGLEPLAALERLCERAGLYYYVGYEIGAEGEAIETLQFCRRGAGRRVSLRHQRAGESLDMRKTNVATCYLKSENVSETVKAIGRGDIKRFEGTFELVKAWDPALEQDNYELYSPSTNENFYSVRDVFRKYALNEAGDYTGSPYNRGECYDFSGVFGTSDYSCRRRRFRPCLSTSGSNESLGYYVELSYNDGAQWWPYSGAFNILLGECGVYVNCNQFDLDMWNAIRKNALRFRVTACVDADEPLTAELSNGPIKASRRVRTVVFDLGRQFRYRQISTQSIFCNASGDQIGEPEEVDDGASLRGALREQLRGWRREQLVGKSELPWVHPDIWPGDVINGIDGRELRFAEMTGQCESAPQVKKVTIRPDEHWNTTIEFGGG